MFPRLFSLGPIHVATYGVAVALGYLVGILWLKSQRERMGLSEEAFWTVIYAGFFGAVFGGKLMYMALNLPSFLSGELGLIRDFRYGFVWYGGVIGCIVAGGIATRRVGVPFLVVADYFGVAGPIGHAIGRIGCLGAGCCFGGPTDLPWGMAYTNPKSLVPEDLLGVPLHPSQLYEAVGNLMIAAVVWNVLRRVQARRLGTGVAFAAYTCLYGLLRFLIEFTRADERGGWLLGMSPAQWTALALSAGAVAWVARARATQRTA